MDRVLLIEDDRTVQAVVEMLLSDEPGLELVGTTLTAEEGIELVGTLRPDVVLLDNQLEGALTGLQAAPALKAAHASIIVLLCTALDAEQAATAEPSIDGYLRKERLIDLADVVHALLEARPAV